MTQGSTPTRQAHAACDLAHRELKARKIEFLLGLEHPSAPLRLLEVGAGAGGIASYFASRPHGRFEVDAVDTVDNRQTRDGYRFQLVSDVQLPFPDSSFDVVISNHVIEHVGDRRAQLTHLREIRRVLRTGGIGYLAVPNRWQVTEPHYGLRFLSWLPKPLRTPYLRWRGKGSFYDCEPLTSGSAQRLFSDAGFKFQALTAEAVDALLTIEHPEKVHLRRWIGGMPRFFFAMINPVAPTLIYKLT